MPLEFDRIPWRITNDDVMGGLSSSRLEARPSGMLFEGELSRENNGGFASALGALAQPLRGFGAIRLTVSGDGRRYQLRLRELRDGPSVAWRAFFTAGEEPVQVTLRPTDFEPVMRGEAVVGTPPLEETVVHYLGFMLTEGEPGAFRLQVHDMEILPRRSLGNTRLVIGASRGIGLALAAAQLSDPDTKTLLATHRPGSRLDELSALRERWPDKLRLMPLDVTDAHGFDRLATQAREFGDGFDLAIHAAGILHEGDLRPEKSLAQCEPGNLARLFEVNSIGPLMTARTLLPAQARKKRFIFAAVSAMVGSIGDNRLGGWYGYRASKAALNQFMRTLANECRLSHPQATVVALHPGTTNTDLSRPFQRNIEPDRLYTAEQTASRMLGVLGALEPADSGRFFNWNGAEIPW
jgi:NAD(P)-dependent dehydrogenase (short-subunit alcohol dehydrogenase family)